MAPSPRIAVLEGALVELDVTPRWFQFQPGTAATYEDAAEIVTAISRVESVARRLLVDLQVGLGGVRLVLVVPAGNGTDALAAERVRLRTALDALDAVHPRRAKVTAARAAEAAAAQADESAPPTPQAPVPAPSPPATPTPAPPEAPHDP